MQYAKEEELIATRKGNHAVEICLRDKLLSSQLDGRQINRKKPHVKAFKKYKVKFWGSL